MKIPNEDNYFNTGKDLEQVDLRIVHQCHFELCCCQRQEAPPLLDSWFLRQHSGKSQDWEGLRVPDHKSSELGCY